MTQLLWGKFRGVVTDISDPLRRARLKAQVPAALGAAVSGWAMPCLPYTGESVSTVKMPPVGTSVWIEFEEGKVPSPIWVGCF